MTATAAVTRKISRMRSQAMSRLIPRKDFAEIMDVTTRTTENWEQRGYGPAPTRIGRFVYYDSAEFAEFVRSLMPAGSATKVKEAAAEDASRESMQNPWAVGSRASRRFVGLGASPQPGLHHAPPAIRQ